MIHDTINLLKRNIKDGNKIGDKIAKEIGNNPYEIRDGK
jgi:hypothetical protein